MSKTPLFKEIDDSTFTKEVTQSDELVFLEFYRDSCSACRVFEPTLNEIADLFKGQIKFLRLNTDTGRFHYERLACSGDPTCIVFYKGEVIGRYVGATMTKYLLPALQQIFKDAVVSHKIKEPIPVSL